MDTVRTKLKTSIRKSEPLNFFKKIICSVEFLASQNIKICTGVFLISGFKSQKELQN